MEKIVNIGNSKIKLRASAATPRLYRTIFDRDIFIDYATLLNAENVFSDEQIKIVENLTYAMAKQADSSIADNIEEWLDSIDGALAIYDIIPDILELWQGNVKTHSEAKKKAD